MSIIDARILLKENGVRGPNMATVDSNRGAGVRTPVVFYNRCNEAGARLATGDFDWDRIFAEGCGGSTSGDTTLVNLVQVEAFAAGGSARIER